MQNTNPLWFSGLTILMVVSLIFILQKLSKKNLLTLTPYLGLGIVSYHMFYTYLIISLIGLDFKKILPLHMCDLTLILIAINFLRPQQILFDISYFWGTFGILCSFLTPKISFPQFYLHYFIFHGLLLFGILWNVFINRQKPKKLSFIKILLGSFIVVPTIGSLNQMIGSNYMFLKDPPNFSFVASYPFHLVSYFFLALVVFFILTLPFGYFFKFNKKELVFQKGQ
jgi:hypothetical integral membrane protein (TIGR02206 family)